MSDENCNKEFGKEFGKESGKEPGKELDKKSKVEADDASTFSTSPDTTNSEVDDVPVSVSATEMPSDDATETPIDITVDAAAAVASEPSSKQGQAQTQVNNPLHGVKLQTIVEELEAKYGWDGLAYRINIKCFKSDPSVKSSLKFLRRTPWARDKVERLYLKTFHKKYRPESY